MSKPLRLFIPGYWYHIYTRGQRQQPLFFSHEDRIKYLKLFDEELNRRGGSIGSFCLMTNHAHFLIRQGEVSLDKIYRKVHTEYATYFNLLRGTKGHVFQGRPGCKIVLNDFYLYQLISYIHNNPVESGIVKRISDYKWSSWYMFENKKCDWIQLNSWANPPGFDDKNKIKKFHEIINKQDYEFKDGGRYIGSENEWNKLQRRLPGREGRKFREKRGKRSMEEIADYVINKTKYSIENLISRDKNREISSLRHKAMALMYNEGYGSTEIGKFFERTPIVVTRAYSKWKNNGKV